MSSSASISKKATVEEAEQSPSPPPASPAKLPESTDEGGNGKSGVIDEPIDSLGNDDEKEQEEEEEEEWDPSSERLPGQTTSKGGKGKNKDDGKEEIDAGGEGQPWQAVWAEQQNAWYFWNTKTGEVSWTNPLAESGSDPTSSADQSLQPPLPSGISTVQFQPPLPSTSAFPSSASASASNQGQIHAQEHGHGYGFAFGSYDADGQPEIDEGLAHLFGGGSGSSTSGMGDGGMGIHQQASFNARTGKFQANAGVYNPGYLDEYNRSKRMNNYYFDVDQWEKQKAEENNKRKRMEEEGKVPERKVTKKDIERFKKKNQERKQRSQAWLRE
ncbi:uncharacterized protein I303_105987 [Kwoniella dejecticola CBS 10117]|uniref:WW domain-containing protein n=1 Tax=Kwoniella dejecticola CBS 10117 TaxID=1296121 RepID=A0AAJ8KRX7_9TREE